MLGSWFHNHGTLAWANALALPGKTGIHILGSFFDPHILIDIMSHFQCQQGFFKKSQKFFCPEMGQENARPETRIQVLICYKGGWDPHARKASCIVTIK